MHVYSWAVIGLVGVFALVAIPLAMEEKNDALFYGYATITVFDADGTEIFSETTHNRLVDEGETFLLRHTFRTNVGNVRIATICLTNGDLSGLSESTTRVDFNTGNSLGSSATPCKTDSSVDTTTTQGFATIGPLIYQAPQNVAIGEDIKGIGICQGGSIGCDNTLFAVIDTTDILNLQQDQTISIRYEFDMRSPDT